jgi:hypothetical protein
MAEKDNGLRPNTDDGSGSGGRENANPGLAADIPPPPDPLDFYPDQLTLYGVKLSEQPKSDKNLTKLQVGDNVLHLQIFSKKKPGEARPSDEVSLAAIFGYSYEGHCYRLDKPRMYIIEDTGVTANGCGFSTPYKMWSIRARTSLMEISVNYDLAEVLVLHANLPGNRAPNTYGNDMQLAHRGGKLSRTSGP